MIHLRRTKYRRYYLRRITKLIDRYANDDQTMREAERMVLRWIAMKRKLENDTRKEGNVE